MAKKSNSNKKTVETNPNTEFNTVDIMENDEMTENTTPDVKPEATPVQPVSLDSLGLELSQVDWSDSTNRECLEPGIMLHDKKVLLNARLNDVMKQYGFTSLQIGYSAQRKAIVIKPFKREGLKSKNFLVSTANFYKEHNINIEPKTKVNVAVTIAGEGDNILFVADLPDHVFLHNQAMAGLTADASMDVEVAQTMGDVN